MIFQITMMKSVLDTVNTTTSTNPIAEDLRIYAILNLREPPRLLISKSGSKQFHCYFGLPLPPQIVVFRLGKCTSVGYRSRIAIEVYLDSETSSFKIGYLDNNVHSACYQPKWPKDFLTRSHILYEKDRMAKLILTVVDGNKNGFKKDLCNVTPEKLQQIEKRQLVVKLSNEITPPERPTKKIKNINLKKTTQKGKKDSFPADCNNNHLVQTSLSGSFSKMPEKYRCITELTPVPSPKPISKLLPEHTPTSKLPCKSTGHHKNNGNENTIWPSSRWGHTACATSENQVVILGGQGEYYEMVKDSLCVLDCGANTWKINMSQDIVANRRMGHTSTFDPVKNVIYVYGGSKNKHWFKDVNILDLDTWKWTDIKGVGNAPKRAYHTSVLFQGELLVFGGVYPNRDPQPDGCSNDWHMFNPETNNWYQPMITGKEPPARSGHSLKLYQDSKAIIFGGWDATHCYNDVFFLDLALMEYNKPDVIGIKPTCRTWHSSVLLAGNRLFIHGGFNVANKEVLGDSFIFDIDKLTWLEVNTSPKIKPCVGHVMFCHQTNVGKEQIMVFGGGDNHGNFFSDLLSIDTFTEKKY